MNIKEVKTKLGEVEYSISGKGTPVLILHGGHSNCREVLSHKGLDLQKAQIIIPSRPGYGKTPLNDHKTPRQAADLFVELLNSLSVEKVIVYGISAGGLTAIELASNYPNRVSKLILASAISKKWFDKKDSIYKTAQRMFNPSMEGFIWGMVRLFSSFLPQMIAKSFFPQFSTQPSHKLKREDVEELAGTFKYYSSGEGFLNDIDQNIEGDVITKIECPTLIIHSKNDNSVSFEHSEHANKMIETSTLVALDNEWGHLLWLGEDSTKSLKIISDFIEEVSV